MSPTGATPSRSKVLKEFQAIPGIGPGQAEDLWKLGLRSVTELKGADAEAMYVRLARIKGTKIDRCQLYAFRCAVYYASRKRHDPELLKWWNWMDKGAKNPAPAKKKS